MVMSCEDISLGDGVEEICKSERHKEDYGAKVWEYLANETHVVRIRMAKTATDSPSLRQ